MALGSSSPSTTSWVVEMALQELQKLETEHPNHFDYLKRELKSLIAEPPLLFSSLDPIPTLLPAATQVSSNRKRKFDGHMEHQKILKRVEWKERECLCQSKCRAERAIERAEACLKMIQQFKHSLFHFEFSQ